jgi:hypothetical protein
VEIPVFKAQNSGKPVLDLPMRARTGNIPLNVVEFAPVLPKMEIAKQKAARKEKIIGMIEAVSVQQFQNSGKPIFTPLAKVYANVKNPEGKPSVVFAKAAEAHVPVVEMQKKENLQTGQKVLASNEKIKTILEKQKSPVNLPLRNPLRNPAVEKGRAPQKIPVKNGNKIPVKNGKPAKKENQMPLKMPSSEFVMGKVREINLPQNPLPEEIVKRVVKKLEKMKIKEEPLKILEYSISYAKEKKIALEKKSFELWRIVWARMDSKWVMLVIDDATRIIVAWGVFAMARAREAIGILNQAMREYGAPRAVVCHEREMFCSEGECARSPVGSLEGHVRAQGIDFLVSVMAESAALVAAQEFLNYVRSRGGADSVGNFAGMYNLRGIRGVAGGVPAFYCLQSA